MVCPCREQKDDSRADSSHLQVHVQSPDHSHVHPRSAPVVAHRHTQTLVRLGRCDVSSCDAINHTSHAASRVDLCVSVRMAYSGRPLALVPMLGAGVAHRQWLVILRIVSDQPKIKSSEAFPEIRS